MTNMLKKNSTTVYLGFTALGFAFILTELLLLNHTGGPRIVAVVTCVLGIVLSIASIAASKLRNIFGIVFVVLALAGVFGFMTHGGARGFRQQAVQAALPTTQDRNITRALNSFANLPPTLSPLALSGLSILGALVSFGGIQAKAGKHDGAAPVAAKMA